MTIPHVRGCLTAVLTTLVVCLAPGLASAQVREPPPEVFLDWTRWNNTGVQALNEGKYERAAQAFRLAIKRLQPYEASEKKLMARSYADLSKVLYHQKRFAEAEPLAKWALSVRDQSTGIKTEALCQSLDIVARIHHAQKHLAEAEPLLKRELALQEKDIGYDHPDIIPTAETLAEVYANLGKDAEAEVLYRRALELRESTSEQSLKEAENLENRASILRQANAGRVYSNAPQQAASLEGRAKALREKTVETVGTAAASEGFATVLRRSGRVDEADSLEVRAKAIRDTIETKAARARAGR